MSPELDISKYVSLALPANSKLFFPANLARIGYQYVIINSVKEINASYIVYNAVCHYSNGIDKEDVLVLEDFQVLKDKRGNDGMQRICGKQAENEISDYGFIDYILESSFEGRTWMIQQILESFSDEYGLSPHYLLANGTWYYIPSISNIKLVREKCGGSCPPDKCPK